MNKKRSPVKDVGLTLVEVLIAMLIFALIMGGFSNLFFATKRAISRGYSRIVVGKLGGWFLNPLQQQYVRQDTWDMAVDADDPDAGNLLTVPPSGITGYKTPNNPFGGDGELYPDANYITLNWMGGEPYETEVEPGTRYYPVYEVGKVEVRDGSGNLRGEVRKVKLTICWEQ